MAKSQASSTNSSKPKIRPLSGYILLKPSDAETKTASGIYLPETAQEKKALGEVMAVGEAISLPGGQYIGAPVKDGEKVYYKSWGPENVTVDGEELKLVKFEDLIAILED